MASRRDKRTTGGAERDLQSTRSPRVLAVALDPVMTTRLTTALADPTAVMRLSPSGEEALKSLQAEHYDLVVCNYPLPRLLLRHFLRELRSVTFASRDCGVIVLSIAELLSGAQRFLGQGANVVLTRWSPMSELHDAAHRLLSVAPRFVPPPTAKISLTTVEGRRISATGIANLSVSGALVKSTHRPPIGAACAVDLAWPEVEKPIHATSRVVRHTTAGREHLVGFALQFEDLSIEDTALIAGLSQVR